MGIQDQEKGTSSMRTNKITHSSEGPVPGGGTNFLNNHLTYLKQPFS
jgi:hypothetical protein